MWIILVWTLTANGVDYIPQGALISTSESECRAMSRTLNEVYQEKGLKTECLRSTILDKGA